MRNLLFISTVFISLNAFCQNASKPVTLVFRNFPYLENTRIIIGSLKIDTLMPEKAVKLKLNNVEDGILRVNIFYPWPADTINIYRDRIDGKIKKVKYRNPHFVALSKAVYINKKQSTEYTIQPAFTIIPTMIANFKQQDYYRSDIFRLTVKSKASDTRLYERFDSLEACYSGLSYYNILDSLYKHSTNTDKIYDDFRADAKKINRQTNYMPYRRLAISFIQKNPDNPVSIHNILETDSLDFYTNADTYRKLLSNAGERAKNSKYYAPALMKFTTPKRVLQPGEKINAPVGQTVNNEKFQYDWAENEFTLIEFWATWCIPCRKQMPEWNIILKKYKDRRFTIIGVALDDKKEQWLSAIKADNTSRWLQVCDLQSTGFNGFNALYYNLEYIPFNILVDKSGRIVKKEITPAELEDYLDAQFK